jgi:hypothetical protein|tara:strand:+ start:289 stop:537 length:249 start_codon:yes stop_codon:yes gene_type:complete
MASWWAEPLLGEEPRVKGAIDVFSVQRSMFLARNVSFNTQKVVRRRSGASPHSTGVHDVRFVCEAKKRKHVKKGLFLQLPRA